MKVINGGQLVMSMHPSTIDQVMRILFLTNILEHIESTKEHMTDWSLECFDRTHIILLIAFLVSHCILPLTCLNTSVMNYIHTCQLEHVSLPIWQLRNYMHLCDGMPWHIKHATKQHPSIYCPVSLTIMVTIAQFDVLAWNSLCVPTQSKLK